MIINLPIDAIPDMPNQFHWRLQRPATITYNPPLFFNRWCQFEECGNLRRPMEVGAKGLFEGYGVKETIKPSIRMKS